MPQTTQYTITIARSIYIMNLFYTMYQNEESYTTTTPILLAALDQPLMANPSSRQRPNRSLERLGSRGH